MKTYRLKIRPVSTFSTPWQADTIFGHLCWSVVEREGESGLKSFLEPFLDGEPSFILSDGFPGDFLPLPLSWSATLSQDESKSEEERFQIRKELKKREWVSLDVFKKVQNFKPFEPEKEIKGFSLSRSTHSQISRLTNTAQEGALFEQEEWTLSEGLDYISIYVKTEENDKETVQILFEDLSETGFGKKKSSGKGQFTLLGLEEFSHLEEVQDPNAFISLSNFIPKTSDPVEGMYKTFVKYGKLGGDFATGNPFKKPLLMFKAGSVFCSQAPIKPFYGRMIEDVAWGRPGIIQYAFAFAVPAKLASFETKEHRPDE